MRSAASWIARSTTWDYARPRHHLAAAATGAPAAIESRQTFTLHLQYDLSFLFIH